MKFTELTLKEFTTFVDSHPLQSFFQTKYMYDRYINENKEVYLVGVKKNKKVVAASLLVKTSSFRHFGLYEALQGLILDYQDQELLDYFVKELRLFLKNKGAYKLIMNPYVPLKKYDSNGIDTKEIDNTPLKKHILKLGFKEIKDYDQVKWIYCLDINGQSKDELFKTFKSNARNYINKTINKYELELKELTYDELPEFEHIATETCNRKNFPSRSLEYFENMYNAFKDQVKFIICYLNVTKYINNLKKEIKELQTKIDSLSDSHSNMKKRENFKLEISQNEKNIKEAENLKKEKGNLIPLAASMFILYGYEIIYLFSGSYEEYKTFFGQYRIQWEIISYATTHNYKRYNFYGIKDITKKENKDNGVIKFKQNFNGYVLNLLGAFALPINKPIFTLEHIYSNILKNHSKK